MRRSLVILALSGISLFPIVVFAQPESWQAKPQQDGSTLYLLHECQVKVSSTNQLTMTATDNHWMNGSLTETIEIQFQGGQARRVERTFLQEAEAGGLLDPHPHPVFNESCRRYIQGLPPAVRELVFYYFAAPRVQIHGMPGPILDPMVIMRGVRKHYREVQIQEMFGQ